MEDELILVSDVGVLLFELVVFGGGVDVGDEGLGLLLVEEGRLLVGVAAIK